VRDELQKNRTEAIEMQNELLETARGLAYLAVVLEVLTSVYISAARISRAFVVTVTCSYSYRYSYSSYHHHFHCLRGSGGAATPVQSR
jgi:hypothetical protein